MPKSEEEVQEARRKIDYVYDKFSKHVRAINQALKDAADEGIFPCVEVWDMTPREVEMLGGKPRKRLDISVHPRQ